MGKNASEKKELEWTVKWEYIIERIKLYMARKTGKELVVMNIEAGPDPNDNYKRFMEACQVVKSAYEVVVTVSLPGEERIFWVNQNIQFYILEDSEKVHVTGNQEIFKEIMS